MQAIVILTGYLLGSVSPAYLLGKLLKGIDLREHGDKNAGTVNAYRVLGLFPAVITAVIDLSKGVLAVVIACSLGVQPAFAHASGLAAILGHVFPFYLNFRGGQGVATATGLLLTYLVFIFKNNWMPWSSLLILVGVVLIFTYIARKGEIVGIVVLPLLFYLVYSSAPLNSITIFFGIVVLYILGINVLNIRRKGVLRLKPETRETIKWSRFFLRPFAIAFPIFYSFYGKKTVLTLVGAVALGFIIMDAVRLAHNGINLLLFKNLPVVFKKGETRRFSSMTMFLVACFVTILIFEKDIAITAIVFLIFGDMFGKFFGLEYGRIRIFHKTLEGSLALLTSCIVAGFVLSHYLNLSLIIFSIGAITAALTEVAPLGVDDNFSVSLISASAMFVTTVF